jgi:hypothetical protein
VRENSRFEMIRAVRIGAMHKAVTSVEMADGSTTDDGSGRTECRDQRGRDEGDDFSDGDYTDIDE